MNHLREFDEFDAKDFDDMFALGFSDMWTTCKITGVYEYVTASDFGIDFEDKKIENFPKSITDVAINHFAGKNFGGEVYIKTRQSKLVQANISVESFQATAEVDRNNKDLVSKIEKEGPDKDFIKNMKENSASDFEMQITEFAISLNFEGSTSYQPIHFTISSDDVNAFKDAQKLYTKEKIEEVAEIAGEPNGIFLEYFNSKGEKIGENENWI